MIKKEKISTKEILGLALICFILMFVSEWNILEKQWWFLLLMIPSGVLLLMCLCVLVMRNLNKKQ